MCKKNIYFENEVIGRVRKLKSGKLADIDGISDGDGVFLSMHVPLPIFLFPVFVARASPPVLRRR